jgi:acyl-coenzyme A synthetase/AMP-(fatty) acid ligase
LAARGDRVLMFLDDTPVYPAAFFGAAWAGLVPLLINLLTPRVKAIAAKSWLAAVSDRLEPGDTHRNDMGFWMYSSDSTGRPKGIVHLHHDMLYTAVSYARHILKLAPDDLCFSVPKIYFAYGFGNSITLPFAVGGREPFAARLAQVGGRSSKRSRGSAPPCSSACRHSMRC